MRTRTLRLSSDNHISGHIIKNESHVIHLQRRKNRFLSDLITAASKKWYLVGTAKTRVLGKVDTSKARLRLLRSIQRRTMFLLRLSKPSVPAVFRFQILRNSRGFGLILGIPWLYSMDAKISVRQFTFAVGDIIMEKNFVKWLAPK